MPDERGESILELIGYLALAGVLVLIAGYFLVYSKDRKLNAAEQAYVIAVATQRADAYIHALATQQAEAPPPAAAVEAPAAAAPVVRVAAPPAPPPVAPPPQATAVSYVPPPPAAPPPSAPPPAPPAPPPAPPPRSRPPMAACIGFLVGLTPDGGSACQQLAADTSQDVRIRNCLGDLIAGTGTTPIGKSDCVNAALIAPGLLSDCLLGLSDQSLYGRTSCRQYYGSQ